ncbi:discoidin domain-containing protein [Cohnella soli]|uniref:Discoidin domain-containing protein n=1 Tax=Cohnella soli TaxID=425005 RepID=A0ABW0HUD3_9BACL
MRKKILCLLVMMSMAASFLIPMKQAAAMPQTVFFVSPSGNDSNPGTEALPFRTIEKARNVVRTLNSNMTGDILVYLRGGTYSLTDTLAFSSNDSGTNGHNVIYKNVAGETPVLSGGTTISGWTLHDASKNIYKASVGSLETRQIYVNGVRAIRARSEGGLPGAAKHYDANNKFDGYTTTDASMQNWGNKSDIEFVFYILWTQKSCRVGDISGNVVTMIQPCWSMTASDYVNNPNYIENAYELLDSAGEWYLDKNAQMIYYKPRAGEDMSTADVVAGNLETLVSGQGTKENPVHHLQFEGITFAHTTWLRPSSAAGAPDLQANFMFDSVPPMPYHAGMDSWVKPSAAVDFTHANHIVIHRNKFTKLGGSGLSFGTGSQDNTITGNELFDISANGIDLGGISAEDHHPTDARNVVKGNNISNNYIHHTSVDYKGGIAIWVGYARDTMIAHNEISEVPYTAISIGWSWGFNDWPYYPFAAELNADIPKIEGGNKPASIGDNVILSNHIHDFGSDDLIDLGGVYLLGSQEGVLVAGNVIHDDRRPYGAIYHDSGNRWITLRNNITYGNSNNFLFSGSSNDAEFNYWDTSANNILDYLRPNDSVFQNNFAIGDGNVPSYILDNAGLEAEYSDLLSYPTVNVAIGKKTAAYYTDGSLATMQAGMTADKAVDGNKGTAAQATNQMLWIEEVDLGAIYTVSKVTTVFDGQQHAYATDYEIQVSETGGNGNFTTVKSVSGNSGIVSEQTFAAVNARYVRIKAVKPDTMGQPGGQMAISELQVYGRLQSTPSPLPNQTVSLKPDYNLALNRPAAAYFLDGSPATMQAGMTADQAVDGNTGTAAQASGQMLWIEEVDLGRVYNINRVTVNFDGNQNAYATDYEIQVSQTGGNGNFTTVKTVNGNASLASEQTFVPVGARYVRIKALKPDAGGQPGGQMAISEIQINEYKNLAYKKTAKAYFLDGSIAQMQAGHTPDEAVDGNVNNYNFSQASNQWRWIQEVDLGALYDINMVKIYFKDENNGDGDYGFATQYEIQVSQTGAAGSFTTVWSTSADNFSREIENYFTPVMARFVRIQANKPDGPEQFGGQMSIREMQVYGVDNALFLSNITSNGNSNKSHYVNLSNQSFTFQAGDVISYDVKLLTDSTDIGGIDILNSDSTRFKDATWSDQHGVTGKPTGDLRSYAYGKWYHRELTIPSSMAGKTSSKWLLALENDSPNTLLQAMYDNIVVKRAGNTVLTVYKDGSPNQNSVYSSSGFAYSSTGVGVMQR